MSVANLCVVLRAFVCFEYKIFKSDEELKDL